MGCGNGQKTRGTAKRVRREDGMIKKNPRLNDSVSSEALVMPRKTGSPSAGLPPLAMMAA